MLGGLTMLLLVTLVGCGGSSDKKNVLGVAKSKADLVVSDKYPFYAPADVSIRLNQEVSFTVYNDGKEIHNVTIPALTIDMDVNPGQTITVKLPAVSAAPRDGFFTMYCKYHQFQGEATKIKIAK
jgi:plastocyanin